MSEKSYNKMLEYFKANKEIKKVWLQGSRVFGITRQSSDIDLIIDISLSDFNRIKKEMYEIQIPYRIDAKNLKTNTTFVKTAIYQGTKLIYNIEDWER
jgi:predicted nucleotidyltransferase